MTFDQHKQHLANEYAALITRHADLPAIGEYIRLRVAYLAERAAYADLPELFTNAINAQQEQPREL
jgi:hypothetical protein